LAYAVPFYKALSKKLGLSLIENKPVLRIFGSIEEQNDWSVASDKPELSVFLSSKFIQGKNPQINAPYGFGEVLGSGIVEVKLLLGGFRKKLETAVNFYKEKFDYELISDTGENVVYKNFEAKKIL